jgi:hypothetical protein
MSMEERNEFRQQPQEEAPVKKNRRRFSVLYLLNGEFLQREYFLKNLPFFFYVAFLLALYIANAYYAENKIREISKAESEIKELHSEYISLKAELTQRCKEYQVAAMLKETGVEVSIIPPRVITVNKTELDKIY